MHIISAYDNYTKPHKRNTRILLKGLPVTEHVDKLYRETVVDKK